MKPQAFSHEILLFTGTSFARRQLCALNDGRAYKDTRRSPADQLEKACWSGLIFETMPYLFDNDEPKSLCVWKVDQAEQFLHVKSGSTANPIEHATSVDPYLFLQLTVWQN